jgi:DNA-binding response OmpR family regulator
MTKILIVDDDAHIRELINLLFRKEGFDLYEASDGMQALKVMEKVKIDLAVIDIMMPNMDGWQLCKELREFSDIPILMLTAKGETTQKVKGFGLGADDYLVKPFEPIELVLRIKALLKRYKITISQTLNIFELIYDSIKRIRIAV